MSEHKIAPMDRLKKIVAFLLGEDKLDGVSFGERPAAKPMFWWRTELRGALAAVVAQAEGKPPQIEPGLPVMTPDGPGVIKSMYREVAGSRDWWVSFVLGIERWYDEKNLLVMTPPALAFAPQVAVPEGWKLVPLEPTPEQVEATMVRGAPFGVGAWYRAMVAAAAPTAPTGDIPQVTAYDHTISVRTTSSDDEQPVSDPDGFPSLTSTVVNDACWGFIEAMPHQLPAPIFNDLKPALYEALKHYHRAVLPAPDEREIGADAIETAIEVAVEAGRGKERATVGRLIGHMREYAKSLRAGKEGE